MEMQKQEFTANWLDSFWHWQNMTLTFPDRWQH
jgi:hypothetical protein